LGCPTKDEPVVRGHDLLHGLPGEFTVVRCVACGLQRTSPRPTPETVGLYYPDDYGPYQGTRVEHGGRGGRGLKARLLGIAKRIFDTKAQALPGVQPGRMLEIGCASGSFLHYMAQRGWQVEGIEYSATAAQSARALGYAVDTGTLESVEKPAHSYDLIVGWMVLEHLHQPVQSLRKLAGWARRDAMLVVSVPNAGSSESRIFGPRWYALQLPTHLFHYDTSTITKIMQAGGWQVVRIHHHRTVANLVASTGYWLRDHGLARLGQRFIRFPETGGRLGALLMFPLALPLAWFGQTGRMTVWARRAC
jgi:2-polyprenyl-3-methyl-5-hydroxy-6-metoxy-1,4-benzoquinol methylase